MVNTILTIVYHMLTIDPPGVFVEVLFNFALFSFCVVSVFCYCVVLFCVVFFFYWGGCFFFFGGLFWGVLVLFGFWKVCVCVGCFVLVLSFCCCCCCGCWGCNRPTRQGTKKQNDRNKTKGALFSRVWGHLGERSGKRTPPHKKTKIICQNSFFVFLSFSFSGFLLLLFFLFLFLFLFSFLAFFS